MRVAYVCVQPVRGVVYLDDEDSTIQPPVWLDLVKPRRVNIVSGGLQLPMITGSGLTMNLYY